MPFNEQAAKVTFHKDGSVSVRLTRVDFYDHLVNGSWWSYDRWAKQADSPGGDHLDRQIADDSHAFHRLMSTAYETQRNKEKRTDATQ